MTILDLYKKLDTNITRIEFQISERVELKNNNKSNIIDFEKKDFIQDSGSYGLSKIDERLVFDNFIVGKSNELAFTAANRIIDNLNKYNPLYIYGGVGLGKTHLLNAIGNKLLKKLDKVIYVSAERFMYQFVRSIKNNDVVKFKDIFRSAKVLIIDDIQFVSGKDVTQEEFFHTFNALMLKEWSPTTRAQCVCSFVSPGKVTRNVFSDGRSNSRVWSVKNVVMTSTVLSATVIQ